MPQLIHSCTPSPQQTMGPVSGLNLLVIHLKVDAAELGHLQDLPALKSLRDKL